MPSSYIISLNALFPLANYTPNFYHDYNYSEFLLKYLHYAQYYSFMLVIYHYCAFTSKLLNTSSYNIAHKNFPPTPQNHYQCLGNDHLLLPNH